jgi:hypothetical protein
MLCRLRPQKKKFEISAVLRKKDLDFFFADIAGKKKKKKPSPNNISMSVTLFDEVLLIRQVGIAMYVAEMLGTAAKLLDCL